MRIGCRQPPSYQMAKQRIKASQEKSLTMIEQSINLAEETSNSQTKIGKLNDQFILITEYENRLIEDLELVTKFSRKKSNVASYLKKSHLVFDTLNEVKENLKGFIMVEEAKCELQHILESKVPFSETSE